MMCAIAANHDLVRNNVLPAHQAECLLRISVLQSPVNVVLY